MKLLRQVSKLKCDAEFGPICAIDCRKFPQGVLRQSCSQIGITQIFSPTRVRWILRERLVEVINGGGVLLECQIFVGLLREFRRRCFPFLGGNGFYPTN